MEVKKSNFNSELKNDIENIVEEEIKDELESNRNKIFKFLKNIIGIIFLKLKK